MSRNQPDDHLLNLPAVFHVLSTHPDNGRTSGPTGADSPSGDAPRHSARHLPPEPASPVLRLGVLAGAAAMIALVIGTTLSSPFVTQGTRIEPARHQSFAMR